MARGFMAMDMSFMEAAQAVGTVVAMLAAGAAGNHQPAAVFAGKAFVAGVGFVIALFILLSLVFTVHGEISSFRQYNKIKLVDLKQQREKMLFDAPAKALPCVRGGGTA